MAPPRQINLLRGWPSPSLLPSAALSRAANTCLTDPEIYVPGLQYGPDPGYEPLREELAVWLSSFYSQRSGDGEMMLLPESQRICVSGGASQNLAVILQVFADPEVTSVWMVSPCYFLAKRIFEDAGLGCFDVGEGDEGVDLEMLEEELRLRHHDRSGKAIKRKTPWGKVYKHIIYCVPTFSNPSGKTMTLSARRRLVELAREYDALIITDDVYDTLQWPTSSAETYPPTSAILPRLVDIDRTMDPPPDTDSFGNAVSNGSFSKVAGPGVRTGWAEAMPKFVYGLSQCGSSRSGGAPSQLAATMMSEMLRNGDLQEHIDTVLKPAYRKRWQIMMEAIENSLLPLGVTMGDTSTEQGVFGGYFLWVDLPDGMNAEELSRRAKHEENLIVAPGALFEVSSDSDIKFESSIRLCFSWEPEDDLKKGIERLAKAMKNVKEGGGTSSGTGSHVSKADLGEFR